MISLFGEPVSVHGIKIYPVTMKNYMQFMTFIPILKVKKNRIPDREVIGMTYLDFLIKYLPDHPEGFVIGPIDMLVLVLALCLDENVIKNMEITTEDINGAIVLRINQEDAPPILIDGNKFEDIRKNILEVNGIEDADYTLSEEVERALENARMEQAKMSTSNPPTLEDMVDLYHVLTGMSYENISNMQIRKFFNNMKKIMMIEDYKICKTAEMSGMVTFKKSIPHWFRHQDASQPYSDVKTNLNEFEQKTREFN